MMVLDDLLEKYAQFYAPLVLITFMIGPLVYFRQLLVTLVFVVCFLLLDQLANSAEHLPFALHKHWHQN